MSKAVTHLSIKMRRWREKWSSYRFSVSSSFPIRVGSYPLASAPGTLPPAKSGSADAKARESDAAVQEANMVQQVTSFEWIYIVISMNIIPSVEKRTFNSLACVSMHSFKHVSKKST